MNKDDTNVDGGGGISPPPPPTPFLSKVIGIVNESISLYRSGQYDNGGTNGISRTKAFSPLWMRDIFDILANENKSLICLFGLKNEFCWVKLFVKEPFMMWHQTAQNSLNRLVEMDIYEVCQDKGELEDIHKFFPSQTHLSQATIYTPVRSEKVEILRGIEQDNWQFLLNPDIINKIVNWKTHRIIHKTGIKRKQIENKFGSEILEIEGIDDENIVALDSIFKNDIYKKAYLGLYNECLRIRKLKLSGNRIVEIIKKLLGYREYRQASGIFRDLDKEYGVFYHADDREFTIKSPHNVIEDYRVK